MTPPRAPSWFSDAEVDALVVAAPTAWWAAFIHLGVGSGLRVSEMLRLAWKDIDDVTGSVRVDSNRFEVSDGREHVSLKVPLPPHRLRVVPVSPDVLGSLESLRAVLPGNQYVFLPDWRIGQLYPRLDGSSRLTSRALAPDIDVWFAMTQRMACQVLARRNRNLLAETTWTRRGLGALRETFSRRTAASVTPRKLAELLGILSVHSVLRYYDADSATSKRGAA